MPKQRAPKIDGWYTKKSFAHFDLPLDFDTARNRVIDPEYVSRRSFWPFVGFMEEKRRFHGKINGRAVVDTKKRPLKYCSHHDGYIHAYYAKRLGEVYEAQIKTLAIDHAVIGYRAGVGNNAELAGKVFDEIRTQGDCSVVAIDITSFFDSIDHATLKKNLIALLGGSRLTPDWFAVFESMTRFSWVEISELANLLKFKPLEPPRPLCSVDQFRDVVRESGLVKTNRDVFGIPQGSPISAVFSNVFMIEFDRTILKFCESIGAYYRRYSDDIVVVCRPEGKDEVIDLIKSQIALLGSAMKISEEKTEISRFKKDEYGRLVCDRPVTYLGFTFDGRRIRLRARTLSRYYRRMTYAARQAARAAREAKSPHVFLRGLLRDLSHLGKKNFYAYAKRSSEQLADPSPKSQLRRHMDVLKRKVLHRGK